MRSLVIYLLFKSHVGHQCPSLAQRISPGAGTRHVCYNQRLSALSIKVAGMWRYVREGYTGGDWP